MRVEPLKGSGHLHRPAHPEWPTPTINNARALFFSLREKFREEIFQSLQGTGRLMPEGNPLHP